ncbi:MAG: hypothetical protein ACLTAC_36085, partial [Hungatella sp.]
MRKSKRITAFVLAAVLACGPTMEAGAAADTPVCDETLYITMDPYGEIKESSVVKSYTTNGSSQIVDYGTYNRITNMTDHAEPVTDSEGKLTFNLEISEDRFYF